MRRGALAGAAPTIATPAADGAPTGPVAAGPGAAGPGVSAGRVAIVRVERGPADEVEPARARAALRAWEAQLAVACAATRGKE